MSTEPSAILAPSKQQTWTMREVFEIVVPADYRHLLPLLRQEIFNEAADLVEQWHGAAPDVYSPQDSAALLRHVSGGGEPKDATYPAVGTADRG